MTHSRLSHFHFSHMFLRLLGTVSVFFSMPVAAGLFDDAVSGKTSGAETVVSDAPAGEASASADQPADTDQPGDAAGNSETENTGAAAPVADGPAPAAQEPTIVERIVEKSGLTFDFNGQLRGAMYIGKMPEYSRVEIKSGYGELGLKLKVSKATYGDAYGEVRFQGGYLNDQSYLGQPTDTPPQGTDIGEFDTRIKLREAYVNAYIGSHFDLRFGYQIIVWGRADGINPTNNLTPVDLRVRSPEEDDRRLGNLALRMNLNFSPIRIEGIWVPMYAPSYMPKIGLADSIVFDDPKYPSMDISKGIYAAKIHLLLSQVEMSVSYLYGYSLQPGLSQVSNNLVQVAEDIAYNNDPGPDGLRTLDDPQVHIARTAYQHQVIGFDFSTDIAGKVGLRGEFAFKSPMDFKKAAPPYEDELDEQVAVPNPELYYVLGIDKTFGNVSLIAQYVGKTILKWDEVPDGDPVDLNNLTQVLEDTVGGSTNVSNIMTAGINNSVYRELKNKNRLIQGQTEQYQHAVSGRIEWKTLHDSLSLSAFGMVNISTLEWLVYPKIAYSITDAMWVTVGGEIYQGPSDSLFGYIEEILTAGYTELKIAF